MSPPLIAILNGEVVEATRMVIPATDAGFVQGITLAEQIRTFRGQPFLVERHLDRLFHGAHLLGFSLQSHHREELHAAVKMVAERNFKNVSPEGDLGITVFVTPGTYPAYPESADSGPVRGVHSYPLKFDRWRELYSCGVDLLTVSVTQVPQACWPSQLKCRSRMHYYLAAREARQQKQDAHALLLDSDGYVSETPIANIVAVFNEHFVSPPLDAILPGISLQYLFELAGQLGMKTQYRRLTVDDLKQADELLLTSTPFCLLPVGSVDGEALPETHPVFDRLIAAWSEAVGVSIVGQATGA